MGGGFGVTFVRDRVGLALGQRLADSALWSFPEAINANPAFPFSVLLSRSIAFCVNSWGP